MSTGVRDEFQGEVTPQELGLDDLLSQRIASWVNSYRTISSLDQADRLRRRNEIDQLDKEGLEISRAIKDKLGEAAKVSYFSEGLLQRILV